MKKYLFIIKVGTTYPDTLREYGDFDLWTIKGLGCDHDTVRVIDAEHGDPLPDANDCGGVVVTGSHDMVTDNLPWSVRVAEWIPALVDRSVPFLGICFGHQLLAYALGGRVGFHPEGTEAGTVKINLLPESASDPLFAFLPLSFHAHVSHSQTVIVLPEGAVRLAMNAFEPNHAFRVGKCAWGVQSHPEYTADIMRSYIINEKEDLLREGIEFRPVLESVKETPEAASILRRFNEFAMMRC
jgi:GMP synthase (glutamine-hydrolysing)